MSPQRKNPRLPAYLRFRRRLVTFLDAKRIAVTASTGQLIIHLASGMIVGIGDWVFHQAAREMQKLQAQG